MNILYLCGSERDRRYVMRRWLDDNHALVAKADTKRYVAELRAGLRIVFHTYSDPDRLRGMEFGMVIRDHGRIEATVAQQHATEEHVRARTRVVKTPPAKLI